MRAIDDMDKAIQDFLEIAPNAATKTELAAHTTNASNPHEVTKAQVGLGNVTNDRQATYADFTAHTSAVNPHGVTKSTIGLGDVDNVKQASKSEYNNHITGAADKHSGNDVMYSQSKSVNAKIDELIIEGGGGTMYHDELLNRNSANAHPIEAITGLQDKLDSIPVTLVFSGHTDDDTATYLTCEDTASDYVTADGYICAPSGASAVALSIEVLGLRPSANGYSSIYGGLWSGKAFINIKNAQGQAKLVAGSLTLLADDEQTSAATVTVEQTATNTNSVAIKVIGYSDKSIEWRANVTISVDMRALS